MNLHSSVEQVGKHCTQIIHSVYGAKKTFHGIDTSTIEEGSTVKMRTKDGRMLIINTANVFITEVFHE